MDIKSPMTAAMKAQAKAAIEWHNPQGEVEVTPTVPAVAAVLDDDGVEVTPAVAEVPAVMGPDPDWAPPYNDYSPRELRHLILQSGVEHVDMTAGWFEPVNVATAPKDEDGNPTFKTASNAATDVS